ncbi:MAG: GAF domain-containing protein, partial [Anaerolineae bacterium]
MTRLPSSKISRAQEEIAALSGNLGALVETLRRQREALQRFQAAWTTGERLSPQDQVLREGLAQTAAAVNMTQQVGSLLSQFNLSLAGLQAELAAQEKEHEQLITLRDVGRVVNSTLNLENLLNLVMDKIISVTGAERGFLMLIDEETGELDFKVARNMDRETIDSSSFEISRSIVYRVAKEGAPIVTTNAQADPRFSAQASVVSYSLRSILCVPLRVKDKITGVIYADNRIKAGLFGDHDRDLLAACADQAAMAIENARLFENVKRNLEEITNMKNLMDNIFASIASGVITTDVMDQITLFNRAAESILCVQAKKCLGLLY